MLKPYTLGIVGLAYSNKQIIKVYEVIPSPSIFSPSAKVDRQKTLTVQTLLIPLPPSSYTSPVRCLGLNYTDHAIEASLPIPQFPVLFLKPTETLIASGEEITIPKVARPVEKHLPDYEVELVVVIGKDAKDVKEDEAWDYVGALTGANDVSFRYHQMAVSQWCFSKNFDHTNPLGPALIAPVSTPLTLKAHLNGEQLQDGSTSDLIFSIPRTIAHLSSGTTLKAGSIILTGTPKGVGFVRKPVVFLKHGDLVKTWVGGGIGSLVNKVTEEGFGDAKSKL